MKYEVGSKVIVSLNKTFQVAIVTKVIRRGVTVVYDIETETGSKFFKVTVDNQKFLIFIDSKKTKKLIDRIDTKLSIDKIKSYDKDTGRNVTSNKDLTIVGGEPFSDN